MKISTAIGVFRVSSGVAGWLAPHPFFTIFGVDVRREPAGRYMSQLYGVRELALGLATLTGDAGQRRQALAFGVAADIGDTLSNVAQLRSGRLPRAGRALVVATTLALAALGMRAMEETDV